MRNPLKLGTSGLFVAGGSEAGHFPGRAGPTQDEDDESHGSDRGGRMYNRCWPGSHNGNLGSDPLPPRATRNLHRTQADVLSVGQVASLQSAPTPIWSARRSREAGCLAKIQLDHLRASALASIPHVTAHANLLVRPHSARQCRACMEPPPIMQGLRGLRPSGPVLCW